MTTPNPKCTSCRCYWKPEENDIKSSGLVYKTCKKCRSQRVLKLKEKQQQKPEEKEIKDKKTAEKITCECGCIVIKNKIARHITTKKHLNIVEEKQKHLDKEIIQRNKYELYDSLIKQRQEQSQNKQLEEEEVFNNIELDF